MKKKMVCGFLAALMVAGTLAGCGGSGSAASAGSSGSDSTADTAASASGNEGLSDEEVAAAAAEASSATVAEGEEGQVINIYVWNQEFQGLVNTYYPEVDHTSDDLSVTYLKDGTEIHWTINPNQDGVYQQKLDEALLNQRDAGADEKIDMFLVEADYALKYTDADADVAVPLVNLGITADDLSKQYKYTQDVVTDVNGVLRGTSWQATPGLFAYRRSIAKDVFGTDDPDEIQALLDNWDLFDEAANKLKEKGYFMVSSVADTYRVFTNNVSGPWVKGTTVTVDPNTMNWVEQSKRYTDEGLNHNVSGQWTDEWNTDQGADSKVFGFFYSTWGINFTLVGNAGDEGFGDWAVCKGPQPFYWGGSWLVACSGTDNPEHVKDIMLRMTADKDILTRITKETQDYTNNEEAMNELAADPDFGSEFLGGQNHIALFAEVAPTIDMSNISAYDQGCGEDFQSAFGDYFKGNVDFDKAKTNFETAILDRYPELTEVVWPE